MISINFIIGHLHNEPMTYLNSYVREMHAKHPHGQDFKEVSRLCEKVSDCEHIQRKNDNIYTLLPKLIRAGLNGELYDKHQENTNVKLAKYEAMEKAIELIKVLDSGEDSQWLAEYMIDKTSTISEVREVFKNYLRRCEK